MGKFLGCIVGLFALVIMLPLWGAMTYAILKSSEAPDWAWVIFWIYLPVSFFFQIAAKIAEAIGGD
jgi:hypothetical protein